MSDEKNNKDKKTEQKKEESNSKEVARKMKVGKNGEIVAKTFEEQQIMAYTFLRSKMLPASFDSVEKVLTAMQFVSELGLKSFTALRQVYIVNGTPNLFGDLPLALARKSGQLEFFEEFLFDEKLNKICFEEKNINAMPFGAVCRVKRKNESMVEKIFTVDDALTAGMFFKDDKGILKPSPKKDCWGKYPKIMLMYRARAAALKVAFSDILNGVGIMEYDTDMMGDNSLIDELDEEKTSMLDEVSLLLSECRKDPKFNKAREIDTITRCIEKQDLRFAEKDDIQKLIDALELYIKENDLIRTGNSNETT